MSKLQEPGGRKQGLVFSPPMAFRGPVMFVGALMVSALLVPASPSCAVLWTTKAAGLAAPLPKVAVPAAQQQGCFWRFAMALMSRPTASWAARHSRDCKENRAENQTLDMARALPSSHESSAQTCEGCRAQRRQRSLHRHGVIDNQSVSGAGCSNLRGAIHREGGTAARAAAKGCSS